MKKLEIRIVAEGETDFMLLRSLLQVTILLLNINTINNHVYKSEHGSNQPTTSSP